MITDPIDRANRIADWLQERFRTDRLREGLKGLIAQVAEKRRDLESARAIYRQREDELGAIDVELLYSAQVDPELKNADARKAAAERLKATDPERLDAQEALEAATRQRDQAANLLEAGELALKSTYHVLNLTTAEIGAIAALTTLNTEA